MGRSRHGCFTGSWKGRKSRSNDKGGTTDALCATHNIYIVAQLKGNFIMFIYTLIYHGNTLYVKKKRHRNVKILPGTRQRENRNNVTHPVV